MPFVDEVYRIIAKGGDGGNGCVSFRRTRSNPRGGPDGGDGGDGGDVILVGSKRIETLEDFLYTPFLRAGHGGHGQSNRKTGARGRGLTVSLPLGTLVKDYETKEVLVELLEERQTYVLAKGGKGGFGNSRFASSTNRAPRWAVPGKKGKTRECSLELKLLSDFGLVGLPSAGKSSLLRALSRATPKVADYPFTTKAPVLGVLEGEGGLRRVTITDLPGLIEGAHQGRGLGIRFLRHIERTRELILVIDASLSDPSPKRAFEILNQELASYSPNLAGRIRTLVLNKSDLLSDGPKRKDLEVFFRGLGFEVFFISAKFGENVENLTDSLRTH
jgi:GTP-binding protein